MRADSIEPLPVEVTSTTPRLTSVLEEFGFSAGAPSVGEQDSEEGGQHQCPEGQGHRVRAAQADRIAENLNAPGRIGGLLLPEASGPLAVDGLVAKAGRDLTEPVDDRLGELAN